MSTKLEVDLFADIEIPEEDFWGKILNKDTQKSPSTLSGNSQLKKETDSETSDDNEIEIVKEVPGTPPDLILQGESSKIEVYTKLYSKNPITNTNLDVDRPLHPNLHKRVLQFRKNCNLHLLFVTWGQIDQMVMRKQRLMRLMTLGTMIQHTTMSKESFIRVHQEYYKLNGQINTMVRQIQQEHKFIITNSS